MVKFYTDAEDGLDISMHWKILIFLAMFAVQCLLILFYRYKPFLSFYCFVTFLVGFPLAIYSNEARPTTLLKAVLIAIPFQLISLWRISCMADDVHSKYYAHSKVNCVVRRALKGRLHQKWMEWVGLMGAYFCNILWAAIMDLMVGSYWNSACGFILALTVPLPSSTYEGTPGYSVEREAKTVDMVVPGNHWLWIMVYVSWNLLFALMYTMNIWGTLLHLAPPFLFCALTRRWDMFPMVRVQCLYVYIMVAAPWVWIPLVLGEPVVIEDELIPIVWGSLNLFGAVCWTLYYVGFIWRKRVFAKLRISEERTAVEVQPRSVVVGRSDSAEGTNQ